MKYLVSLLIGMLIGAALFAAGMYYNPFTGHELVSPLAVSKDKNMHVTYTAVPGEMILYTDDGESTVGTWNNLCIHRVWVAVIGQLLNQPALTPTNE